MNIRPQINRLLRNPLVRVFALILIVAFVGGAIVRFTELRNGSNQFGTLLESLWWAVVTMTTVGYGDYAPEGTVSRALAVLIMFAGISLTSFLTGTIASVIVARRLRANQGLLPIKVKNHIIICGWHHKIENLLNAFLSHEDDQTLQVVLVNLEHEDRMQAIKNEFDYTRVKYIRGEFTKESILKQANLEHARAVIILPTELTTGGFSDEKTILATLTIKNIRPEVNVVAYVNDRSTIMHLKRAKADHVVLADNFGSFLISSHILQPGIPEAAEQLLDHHSARRFRRVDIPGRYVGRTFAEYFLHIRRAEGWIPIALFSEEERTDFSSFLSADASALDAFIERKLREAGKGLGDDSGISVQVNPPDEYIIKKTEKAIVIP